MKAAKEKMILLVFIALALFTCAPSFASATALEISKPRAELKSNLAGNRVGQSLFYSVKRDRNYDSFGEVALESSVAPRTGGTFGHAGTVNPTGAGTPNCVNCSITLEHHFRGLKNVNAAPSLPQGLGPITAEFGGQFEKVGGAFEIASRLSKLGDGSRGIVAASGDGLGHVFNVRFDKGVVRFLDGQSGGLGVDQFDFFTSFKLLITNTGR